MREYFARNGMDLYSPGSKESIIISDCFGFPHSNRQHISFKVNELAHMSNYVAALYSLPKFMQAGKKNRMPLQTIDQDRRIDIDRTL